MPPKQRFDKWITIPFTKSLHSALQDHIRYKGYDSITSVIHALLVAAVDDKAVSDNIEMRSLLRAIKAGVTESTQEDILSRVDKVLEDNI